MKKVTLLFALVAFIAFGSQAQDYKPFKFGTGFGYAIPSGGGGGLAFYLEPAYRLSDEIALGLKWEGAIMGKAVGDEEAKAALVGSYTLNGQYYLSNNKFRPFVGLGFGLYSNASVEFEGESGSGSVGSSFGFYPRVGFDFGHFNMILDYNIIGATKEVEIGGQTVDLGDDKIKNSYIGIKFGVSIGGGNN